MNNDELRKFTNDFLMESLKLSENKAIEYTISHTDRHRNFKKVAERVGIDPRQALMTYLLKHVDSICNYLKTGKFSAGENLRSRCIDLLNYTLLLASLDHSLTHTKGINNASNTQRDRSEPGEDSRHSETQSEPQKWNELRSE